MPPRDDYVRSATVLAVVDGDTLELDVDLGFRLSYRCRCRVLGVDCPEARGPTRTAGEAAREFTRRWVADAGSAVVVRTRRDKGVDSFGRVLAEVWDADGRSLAESLAAAGHAVGYTGRG